MPRWVCLGFTPSTSIVTPRTEWFNRRRVSGIHISQTLVYYIYLPLSTPTERMVQIEKWSTDFSITPLGCTCIQHPTPCVSLHGTLDHFTPFLHSLTISVTPQHHRPSATSDPRCKVQSGCTCTDHTWLCPSCLHSHRNCLSSLTALFSLPLVTCHASRLC
jgi:hypothetical protein